MNSADVDELLNTADGRAIVMAAYYQNKARYIAEMTGLTSLEILETMTTLVTVGLVASPSVALDGLVAVVGDMGAKRKIRLDLLRDKLVLYLYKTGQLNNELAEQLLNEAMGGAYG